MRYNRRRTRGLVNRFTREYHLKVPLTTLCGPQVNSISTGLKFRSLDRYPVTKLIEIFIVQKIARLPKATGISAVNPGLCRTEIGPDAGGFVRALFFKYAVHFIGFLSNHPVLGS